MTGIGGGPGGVGRLDRRHKAAMETTEMARTLPASLISSATSNVGSGWRISGEDMISS